MTPDWLKFIVIENPTYSSRQKKLAFELEQLVAANRDAEQLIIEHAVAALGELEKELSSPPVPMLG